MTTTRRALRMQLGVGLAALAVLATSTSVAVVRLTRDEPPTAVEVLAEARTFVVDQGSVTFRGSSRQESAFGGLGFFGGEEGEEEEIPPEEATTIVSRSVIEGEAVEPDRTRTVTRADGYLFESITIGDESWFRSAEDEDELGDEKWISPDELFEFEDGPFGGGFPGMGFVTALSSLGDPVVGLTELIDRTVDPTITSHGNDATIVRAGLDPRVEAQPGFSETTKGTVEITVDDDGRPLRSVLEQTIETESDGDFPGFSVDVRVELEYAGWGTPIVVDPPADADIDRTPYVQEEAIAELLDVPLYQPRGLPEGWVLDYADAYPGEEFGEGCDEVEVSYTDPHDEYFGYLSLYQSDLACAETDPPDDSSPFVAGPNRGWIEDVGDGYVYAQIVVGQTVITADTDMSAEVLARVLSQLRTLDFNVEPDSIPGLESGAGIPS